MRLIIGGACQGKRTYAAAQYGLSREDIRDCSDFAPGDFAEKKCVCRFHLFLRNQMKSGGDVIAFPASLALATRPDPLELVRKCYLAAHAESVERVVCGCGVRIK